jgi:2-oxoglutarate dehydrogenase E2 component (dihydrolipoamide succinyltransferase)
MDVIMPQLGETVTEGTVTVWHKKVGDKIEVDELLFEVGTDKVETEIPAPVAGTLTEILVAEGETVDVGVKLAKIDDGKSVAPEAAIMDIIMPQLGETVAEGTVTVWHKSPGDDISADELLFEVGTDKVETEITSPMAGTLREILVAEGKTVVVGTRLAVITLKNGAAVPNSKTPELIVSSSARAAAPKKEIASPRVSKTSYATLISPVVARLLSEHNLNAADITGTGRDGRIRRKDILAYTSGGLGSDAEVVPFTYARRITAEHMVQSKATSPHVLQAIEVDFQSVNTARSLEKDNWKSKEGIPLTYLPFIAHAVCKAIPDFPRINASVVGESLHIYKNINLGIAVDLGEDGLVVPVIKNASDLLISQLAVSINDVATKARAGALTGKDFTGATYTLTNNGSTGTFITAPIISQPQVAILSTDGIRKKPVVIESEKGDEIAIRPIGVLAQSFDHRAIDGAYSGGFLSRVKQILEQTDWAAELS